MYKRIMVPLDGSELAECVLPHVETIARATQASVDLVRVIQPIEIPTRGGIALTPENVKQIEKEMKEEAEEYLSKTREMLRNKGFRVQSKYIFGKVAESLIDYAKTTNADLIIMTTHGRSGISRWVLGSVADRILHVSHIPVLLIRAPGCLPGV